MRRDLPPARVTNERIKSASGLLFNGGGALAGAVLVRFYNKPIFDGALALWSFGAALLIYLAWLTLLLLEPEVDDVRG